MESKGKTIFVALRSCPLVHSSTVKEGVKVERKIVMEVVFSSKMQAENDDF
jgi:hypothetical protein